MKEIKNILIIGLGAIGSIYATKLYDFNPGCVKVLLDKTRYEKYRKNGIIFNGSRYDFDYLLDTEKNFNADLILIVTKATDFEQASDMIKNFVGKDTIIMSLLNGISSEEILFKKYGQEKVLYSYYTGHPSMKSGLEIKYDGIGITFFGDTQNKKLSPKVQSVKNLFDKIGIDYQIPEDMLSSLWQKFVINVGINQTSAILNAPYSILQKSENARNIAKDLMSEAVEISKKLNINGSKNFINVAFELIDSIPGNLKPSMLQDIENNKITEVDIFAGEVCRLGKKYNIPTPKNELVFDIIKSMDERNQQVNSKTDASGQVLQK